MVRQRGQLNMFYKTVICFVNYGLKITHSDNKHTNLFGSLNKLANMAHIYPKSQNRTHIMGPGL